jgi:hypothetical protein
MATSDYVLANASGAAFRADLNATLQAIVSNNSSATEPNPTFAFMWWVDTANNLLKQRNTANSAWITIGTLDGGRLLKDGSSAAPALAFAADTDTGLTRGGANQLKFVAAGDDVVTASSSNVVINEGGNNLDVRVEGQNNSALLCTDASTDRVGIGVSDPGTLVEIVSEAPYVTIRNSTQEDNDGGRESKVIFEGEQSGGEISTMAEIGAFHQGDSSGGASDDQKGRLVFFTNGGSAVNEVLTLGGDGDILFCGTSVITPGKNNTDIGASFEKTANGPSLYVSNDATVPIFVNRNTTGPVFAVRYQSVAKGGIDVTTTSVVYNTSSDYRLKENIVGINDAIDRVKQLKPKRFNFIQEPSIVVDGFMAHEAQEVVPESVTGAKDGIDDNGEPVYQGIDHSKLVPLLTAALQDAISQIETLTSRVDALEA